MVMHGQVHAGNQEQAHGVTHALCHGLLGLVEEPDHITQQHSFTDLACRLEQTTDAGHTRVQAKTAQQDLVQVGSSGLLSCRGGSLFGLNLASPFLEHQIGQTLDPVVFGQALELFWDDVVFL